MQPRRFSAAMAGFARAFGCIAAGQIRDSIPNAERAPSDRPRISDRIRDEPPDGDSKPKG
jgi:hypothetical protein